MNPENKKAMKAYLSSTSSARSTMTTTTMVEESETKDNSSCYFPGCRKDANCNCDICLASISATLDLMPYNTSSLSKLSAASRPKPSVETTPISFDRSVVSTPRSSSRSISKDSEVKMEKKEMREEKRNEGGRKAGLLFNAVLKMGLFLGLLLVAFRFSWVVNGVLRPQMTNEIVKKIGERTLLVGDLNERLRILQDELKDVVVFHGKVSNCSETDSKWEISQDGLLLNSRCVMYKSATEELSVWGWPLQTAGLLATGFSTSSFTILSGRLTEWSNGKIGFLIRKENSSWAQSEWSSSVVQLDPNTWILEYRRSSILDTSSLFSGALDLVKHMMSRAVRNMKEEFFCYSNFASKAHNNKIPT